jgi:hypothetical protein
VQWLNLGDYNTKLFFRAMKNHQSKNKTMSVCKEDGTIVENPTKVKEEIVGLFQRLLSEVPSNTPIKSERA